MTDQTRCPRARCARRAKFVGESPDRQTPQGPRPRLGRRVSLLVLVGALAAGALAAPASGQSIDGGFESPSMGPGYFYRPTGSAWTFTSTSGIIVPPSDFGSPAAPQGSQIGFVQSNTGDPNDTGVRGTISQSVTFPSAGIYTFGVQHTSREGVNGATRAAYEVQLDGVNVGGTWTPSTSGSFKQAGFTFAAPAGPHVVSLVSVGPSDTTTFVDAVTLAPAPATAGKFSQARFTGDADSRISSAKTYTHAVNFNRTGAAVTVNGVSFANGGTSGSNYSLSVTNSFVNNSSNLTGDSAGLVTDFFYGGTENLTLTGLIPGRSYVTTLYGVGFGGPGGRFIDITDSQGGSISGFDQNTYNSGNGILLMDSFTAASDSITLTLVPQSPGDSFHMYAFSNELVPAVPEPGTLAAVVLPAGIALMARRRHRR